jgi:hypothetical protein
VDGDRTDLQAMTASELTAMILARLIRTEGGSRQAWRRRLGEMRIYSPATHPHCNWDFADSIPSRPVEAVLDWARTTHPRITAD